MGKIAIGRSIGGAFDLTFERYTALFGVVWLPVVAVVAFEYFVFGPLIQSLPDFLQYAVQHPGDQGPPPGWYRPQAYAQLVNLVVMLAAIWIRVGITKVALDLPRGPKFAYIFVGLDELRVILGYLVYLAIIYGLALAAVIVAGVVGAVAGALISGGVFAGMDLAWLKPWGVGAFVVGVVALVAALIYVQARLVYLLVPVTVVEKRFGLWRSWELSKGNFWRIVVVAVGTAAPLLLLEILLLIVLYVPIVIAVVAELHKHPEIVHNRPALNAAVMANIMKDIFAWLPFFGAIGLLLAPVFCGLLYSPSAYAYQSLTEKEG